MYEAYVFDVLQRPTNVEENGATSGLGLLATYTYDTLGRLTGITRGNGANSTLGYDGADRIASLAHSFVNTSANVTWTFTYDAANGVLTRSATNDAYTSHPGALSLSYTANGLNQYSSVSGTTYSYDTRGNLTSDTARTFTYDVDNKLLTGSAPTAATFTYDPLGRMQTDTASGATTTFLYDGDNLSAEYNSSGTVLRRYAPSGLGEDQPLVWYEGSGTTSRQWLHSDNQGSIAAYSNASGDQAAAYGYSPYGEPGAWSGSRYSYTGQLMIPEALLYNYKARAYDPKLGRFLQTDPIGYGDDVNAYAYARDDSTNGADPTGTSCQPTGTCDEIVITAPSGPSNLPGGTPGGGGFSNANNPARANSISAPPSPSAPTNPCTTAQALAASLAHNMDNLATALDLAALADGLGTLGAAAGEAPTLGGDTPVTFVLGGAEIPLGTAAVVVSGTAAALHSFASGNFNALNNFNATTLESQIPKLAAIPVPALRQLAAKISDALSSIQDLKEMSAQDGCH